MVVLKIFWLFWIIFNVERGVNSAEVLGKSADEVLGILEPEFLQNKDSLKELRSSNHSTTTEANLQLDSNNFEKQVGNNISNLTGTLEDYIQNQTMVETQHTLNIQKNEQNESDTHDTYFNNRKTEQPDTNDDDIRLPEADTDNNSYDQDAFKTSAEEGSGNGFDGLEDVYNSKLSDKNQNSDSIISTWNENDEIPLNTTVEDIFNTTEYNFLDMKSETNGSSNDSIIERWLREQQFNVNENNNNTVNHNPTNNETLSHNLHNFEDLLSQSSQQKNPNLFSILSKQIPLPTNFKMEEFKKQWAEYGPRIEKLLSSSVLDLLTRLLKGSLQSNSPRINNTKLLVNKSTTPVPVYEYDKLKQGKPKDWSYVKKSKDAFEKNNNEEFGGLELPKDDETEMIRSKIFNASMISTSTKTTLLEDDLNNNVLERSQETDNLNKTVVDEETDEIDNFNNENPVIHQNNAKLENNGEVLESNYQKSEESLEFMETSLVQTVLNSSKTNVSELIDQTETVTVKDIGEGHSSNREFIEWDVEDVIPSPANQTDNLDSEDNVTDEIATTEKMKVTAEEFIEHTTASEGYDVPKGETTSFQEFQDNFEITENTLAPLTDEIEMSSFPVDAHESLINKRIDDAEDDVRLSESTTHLSLPINNKNNQVIQKIVKTVKEIKDLNKNVDISKIKQSLYVKDDINQNDNMSNSEEYSTTNIPADDTESIDQLNTTSAVKRKTEDGFVGPHICGFVCINETLCISLNASIRLFINNKMINLNGGAAITTKWEPEEESASTLVEWYNVDNNSYNLTISIRLQCMKGYCFVESVLIKITNGEIAGILDTSTEGEVMVERQHLDLFKTQLGNTYQNNSKISLRFDQGIVLDLSDVYISTYENDGHIPNFSATSSYTRKYYIELLIAAAVGALILCTTVLVLCRKCRQKRDFKLNAE